jgi:hypothetical protein
VSIFKSCGLGKVTRAECSRRFRLRTDSGKFELTPQQLTLFAAEVRARGGRAAPRVPLQRLGTDARRRPNPAPVRARCTTA